MKQKLKLRNVFSLVSLLVLFGCTEERDYIEKNNLQNIKFSTISFEKLLIEKSFKKTNERILIEKQKTAGGRSSIENYYNFDFVEGSDANIIEIDNRKYYNILIRRSLENPNYTENLLILVENINNVEEISAFIIKYNLSNESSLNDLTDIDKEITPLFARTIMYCYNVCTTFCYNTIENSPKYSEPHYPGSDCTNSSFIATTCSPECKEITIGVLGDSSYTPPFENPFGGGGTTGSSDQTTIVTTPQNQNGSTQNTDQLILAPVLDDVEDEPTIDPCKELIHLVDPRPDETIINDGDTIQVKRPRLKAVLNALRGNLGGTKESGIELRYNPNLKEYSWNYAIVTSANKNADIELSIGGTVYGGVHVHTKYLHGIPSFGDLVWLRDCNIRVFTPSQNMVVSIVVCKNPKFGQSNEPETITYALKINDFTNLDKKIKNKLSQTQGKTDKIKLERILESDGDINAKNPNNLESKFLEMYGSMGFELFKANDDLTNWNKLTKNANGTIASNPCN